MELTRRSLLTGTGALVVASCILPKAASPFDRWQRIKDILNPSADNNLEILLENLHNLFKTTYSLPSWQERNTATLMKIVLPVTVGAYAQLLAPKLIPVQAMRSPVDFIYQQPVAARTRKMSVRWTFEVAGDSLPAYHPDGTKIDLEAEIMAALALETAAEHNREHLRVMRSFAHRHTDEVTLNDDLREAIRTTARAMNPPGQWAVVNVAHATRLGYLFAPLSTTEPITYIDNIAVYCDPYAGDRTAILIGTRQGTAMVWAPYVLLLSSGVCIDPHTFEPVVSFMTRYGILIDEAKMAKEFVTLPVETSCFGPCPA